MPKLKADLIVDDKGSIVVKNFTDKTKRYMHSAAGSVRGVTSALTSMQGLLAGAGFALGAKHILDTASSFEQLEKKLNVITHGKGAETLERINAWALKMPIDTVKATAAFVQMAAYGLEPNLVKMQTLVDVASIYGEQSLPRVARALGQMKTLGKLSQEEINQFSEVGISAAKYLREAFSMSVPEIQKAGIDIDRVIKAIMTGLDRDFGGAAQANMDSWVGLKSTTVSYITELERRVMDAGLFTTLKDQLGGVNEKLKDWVENNDDLITQKVPEYIDDVKDGVKSIYDIYTAMPEGVATGLVGAVLFGPAAGFAIAVADYLFDMEEIKNSIAGFQAAKKGDITWLDYASADAEELAWILDDLKVSSEEQWTKLQQNINTHKEILQRDNLQPDVRELHTDLYNKALAEMAAYEEKAASALTGATPELEALNTVLQEQLKITTELKKTVPTIDPAHLKKAHEETESEWQRHANEIKRQNEAQAREMADIWQNYDQARLASMPDQARAIALVTREYDDQRDAIDAYYDSTDDLSDKQIKTWEKEALALDAREQEELYGLTTKENAHQETAAEVDKIWDHAFDSIADSMTDWIKSGELDLNSLADFFEDSVARMVSTWLVGQAKMVFFGKTSNGVSTVAGAVSNDGTASSESSPYTLYSAGSTIKKAYGTVSGWFGADSASGAAADGGTLTSGGSTAPTSSSGLAGISTATWVAAAIVAQHYMAGKTDTVFEGHQTGDAFSGDFGNDPWLGFASDKLGLQATPGEKLDAAVANGDWGLALKRLPAAVGQWSDPISTLVGGIGQKYGGDVGGWLTNPVGKLLGFGGGEDTFTLNELTPYVDSSYNRTGGFDETPFLEASGTRPTEEFVDIINTIQTDATTYVADLSGSMTDGVRDAFYTALESQSFAVDANGEWGVSQTAEALTGIAENYATKIDANINAALLATLPLIADEMMGDNSSYAILTTAMQDQINSVIHGGEFGTDQLGQLQDYLNQIALATAPIDEIMATKDLSEYELSLRNINQQFDAYGSQLEAAGIDLAKYTDLELARADAIKQVAEANQLALSQAALTLANTQLDTATTDLNNSFAAERNRLTSDHSDLLTDYNNDLKTVNDTVNELSRYVDNIHSAKISMDLGTDAFAANRFASASSTVNSVLQDVRAGDFSTLDKLDDTMGIIAKPSEDLYASFTDYQRDYYKSYQTLTELEQLTSGQLSADERTAASLETMIDVETTFYDNQLTAMDAQLTALLNLSLNNGTGATPIPSIDQATGAYTTAVAAVDNTTYLADAATKVDYTPSMIRSGIAASGVLGADPAGIFDLIKEYNADIYDVGAAYGFSSDQTDDYFKSAGIPGFAVGTDYVPYDMTANIHQGERITPAAYNRSDKTNADLLAEIKALREELQAQGRENTKNNKKTAAMLDAWNIDGMPEIRV